VGKNLSAFCGAFPILPGKVDEAYRLADELSGARADEWTASLLRLRVNCGEWFLQRLGGMDLLIVWFEAEDPEAALVKLANSGEAFDMWFCQALLDFTVEDLHEIAMRPMPRKILDYSV
jgi:hypothetical protein